MILIWILFQYLSLSSGSFPMKCWWRLGWRHLIWWSCWRAPVWQCASDWGLASAWGHRWSQSWGYIFVGTFSPHDHAHEKDGKCNSDHGRWRYECPMGVEAWSGWVLWKVPWLQTCHCALSAILECPCECLPYWLNWTAPQFYSPVRSFLDFYCLQFVCREHVVHGPDVATLVSGDGASWF